MGHLNDQLREEREERGGEVALSFENLLNDITQASISNNEIINMERELAEANTPVIHLNQDQLREKYLTGEYACFYRDTKMSKWELIDTSRFSAPSYKYQLILNNDMQILEIMMYIRKKSSRSCGIKNTTIKSLYRNPQDFINNYNEAHNYSFAGDSNYIQEFLQETGPSLTFRNGKAKKIKGK